jgi:indolepyruvate ferredoxin oxidoreductase
VITQDATGMAQMGGATWSHIQIANDANVLHATKVDIAMADLVIACDTVVGANKFTLSTMLPGRTFVVLNSHVTPTAAFVRNPDWQAPTDQAIAAISHGVGSGQLGMFDAEQMATQLLGQSIYSNLMLLGYAWQKGRVPLTQESLMRAIELNGVQVENNKAAFEWGRHCAHDLARVPVRATDAQVIQFTKKPSLNELISKRAAFLTQYQNRSYAARYEAFVDEVARLHTDTVFANKVQAMFEGDYKLVHHLAPPLFARRNSKGEHVKRPFGPWVRSAFRGLAALRGLRGTAFDPFGYTAERRTERAMVGEYRACIEELLQTLSNENLALALEIAALPETIRGYGHVKAHHIDAARVRWATLMGQWRNTCTATHEQAPVQRTQSAT